MPNWLKTLLIAIASAFVTILQSGTIQDATGIEKNAIYRAIQIEHGKVGLE